MANKYLDDNGLLYVWQKIKTYISNVVPTKQSDLTNDDYTVKDENYLAYKTKVDNLETKVEDITTTGGEPNVLESVQINSTALPINNKTVNLQIAPGTANGTIAFNGNDIAVKGLGTAAYADATNFDVNGAAAAVKGFSSDAAGTPTVYGALASAQAALDGVTAINNAGYQTASDVDAAIDAAIADVSGIDYEVITEFPETGKKGVIYLVANNGTSPNVYDEYIWYNNKFEKIGTTDVDLSGYLRVTDMVAITNAEIDTIPAN